MTKQTQIQQLIKLITENPDLEVVAKIDSEVIFAGDDFSWYMGIFGNSEIDFIYDAEENILIGRENVCDHIAEELMDREGWEDDKLEEETDLEFERLLINGKVKKKIIVHVGV